MLSIVSKQVTNRSVAVKPTITEEVQSPILQAYSNCFTNVVAQLHHEKFITGASQLEDIHQTFSVSSKVLTISRSRLETGLNTGLIELEGLNPHDVRVALREQPDTRVFVFVVVDGKLSAAAEGRPTQTYKLDIMREIVAPKIDGVSILTHVNRNYSRALKMLGTAVGILKRPTAKTKKVAEIGFFSKLETDAETARYLGEQNTPDLPNNATVQESQPQA